MATQHGAWALGFERRCGMLAPGRSADLTILRPSSRHADPSEAVLDPATQIAATFRRGRVIAGSIS
jgi:cytosine/adenosine deaminase-related metal-dependent hydrolase